MSAADWWALIHSVVVQVTADVEAVADKPSTAQQKAPPAVVRARMSLVW